MLIHGAEILKKIAFKNCSEDIKVILRFVVEDRMEQRQWQQKMSNLQKSMCDINREKIYYALEADRDYGLEVDFIYTILDSAIGDQEKISRLIDEARLEWDF